MRIFEPVLGDNKAKSVLFKGDHTRVKSVQMGKGMKGMFAFAKKVKFIQSPFQLRDRCFEPLFAIFPV